MYIQVIKKLIPFIKGVLIDENNDKSSLSEKLLNYSFVVLIVFFIIGVILGEQAILQSLEKYEYQALLQKQEIELEQCSIDRNYYRNLIDQTSRK